VSLGECLVGEMTSGRPGDYTVRWKMHWHYNNFIQETVYQISYQSPEFCRRYFRKHFGLFFRDTQCNIVVWLWRTHKSYSIRYVNGTLTA